MGYEGPDTGGKHLPERWAVLEEAIGELNAEGRTAEEPALDNSESPDDQTGDDRDPAAGNTTVRS